MTNLKHSKEIKTTTELSAQIYMMYEVWTGNRYSLFLQCLEPKCHNKRNTNVKKNNYNYIALPLPDANTK